MTMVNKNIVVIPGDGIGTEITTAAVAVLHAAAARTDMKCICTTHLAGGAAIDEYGVPLPEATVAAAKVADAVLLGAVGGPKWDNVAPEIRPEKAILGLRKSLGLFGILVAGGQDFAPGQRAVERGAGIDGDGGARQSAGGLYPGQRPARVSPGL